MSLNPITHLDRTQYLSMIPETLKIEDTPMPTITFTNRDGDEISVMLFSRLALVLRDRLDEILNPLETS